jgi:hypothetical protein
VNKESESNQIIESKVEVSNIEILKENLLDCEIKDILNALYWDSHINNYRQL